MKFPVRIALLLSSPVVFVKCQVCLGDWDLCYDPDTTQEISQFGQGYGGTIPSEIGLLTALTKLVIEASQPTKLTGTIPSEIGLLTDVGHLSFFDQALTGTIPSEFGLLTALTQLYLDANSLTGSIPSELGDLNVLFCNLRGNAFCNTDSKSTCVVETASGTCASPDIPAPTISKAPTEAPTTALTLTAFRCDDDGDASTDTNLELGETYFLCVNGDQDAVIVKDINSLNAIKAGVSDLPLIAGGTPNTNTFVFGKESEKVIIATRLPATFFEADGFVTLEGTAEIKRGGGNRKLAQVRILQESTESADFSMTVKVESSSAASVSAFGVVTVFGVVVALVL